MEQTPLELYETAYKLHYHEHQIANAVTYYQRLIKEFPDSNECGYAVIQLQKIKASEVAEDLASITSRGKRAATVLPVIILILLVAAAATWGYIRLSRQLAVEQHRVVLALNALAKISIGNHNDALALLSEMKMLKKDDIMPFELAAYIYRNDNKLDLAQSEYTTFFTLNPDLTPSKNERWFMQLSDAKKSRAKPDIKAPVAEVIPPPVKTKKAPPAPRVKKKNAAAPPPPVKSERDILLVDPDSISYF